MSCLFLVGLGWFSLVALTVLSAFRGEPGWSMAPVTVVLISIPAFLLLALIWAVVGVGRLHDEIKRPLGTDGSSTTTPLE